MAETLKIFDGYSIDKLTIISNICQTSNNIGEDIIKCLSQEQTQLQATPQVTPITSTTTNVVQDVSGSQLVDSDISILNTSMTGLTIQDTSTIITDAINPDMPPVSTVKNRGNGAGGANTNINGLSYEAKTDLATEYIIYNVPSTLNSKPIPSGREFRGTGVPLAWDYNPMPTVMLDPITNEPIIQPQTYDKYTRIKFICNNKIFIKANKCELYKIMKDIKEIKIDLEPAAGCKNPDEAYIALTEKRLYIIEKKFQQTSGSVDEKIQTGVFKKYHYGQLFPNFTISYIYCLSDWFKKPEYKSVIQYLKDNQIQIFWGAEPNYKQHIIDYMCSAMD